MARLVQGHTGGAGSPSPGPEELGLNSMTVPPLDMPSPVAFGDPFQYHFLLLVFF